MSDRKPAPSLRRIRAAGQNGVLVAAAVMAGVGWASLYQLIIAGVPLAFGRWLFFILLYIATTGTALPFVWILNRRFAGRFAVSGGVMLRESMWIGLFFVIAAWLQMIRTLNLPTGFFIGLTMVVIEVFLRLRERARADS